MASDIVRGSGSFAGASVSSTGRSVLTREDGWVESSSEVVEVSESERIEGEREGSGEDAEVSESECWGFDSVEGVVKRKGPFVRRRRAMIDDLWREDIITSPRPADAYYGVLESLLSGEFNRNVYSR